MDSGSREGSDDKMALLMKAVSGRGGKWISALVKGLTTERNEMSC